MKLSDIAVATITRVRGRDDERTVRRSLRTLVATGIPVAASDGGSPNRFVGWLGRLPNVTLAKRGDTLVRQVRASVAVAHKAGRPFILYTEPDKRDFFNGALSGFVERASSDGSIGIHLAARSDAALRTFPSFQRLAEASASDLCRRTIGGDMDYFYGPFLVRRELARLVFGASDDLGWGWRPFLFVTVSRLGHRVVSHTLITIDGEVFPETTSVRVTKGASGIAIKSTGFGNLATTCAVSSTESRRSVRRSPQASSRHGCF